MRMKPVLFTLIMATAAHADAPTVAGVAVNQSDTKWNFSVTLSHPDTGWNHYADGWRVETMSGEVLETRVLSHPHVAEQPFTRSLNAISIPAGTQNVQIRAKCLVDGWSETATIVPLRH